MTISYTGLDGISIHTPARGVTLYNLPSYYSECISIHTPARGVTNARQKPVHFIVYFNPHSRKGSDWQSQRMNQLRPYFNPHSRKGSDHDSTKRCTPFLISIHTPARGVTSPVFGRVIPERISIHTPARGVT